MADILTDNWSAGALLCANGAETRWRQTVSTPSLLLVLFEEERNHGVPEGICTRPIVFLVLPSSLVAGGKALEKPKTYFWQGAVYREAASFLRKI